MVSQLKLKQIVFTKYLRNIRENFLLKHFTVQDWGGIAFPG